MSEIDLFEDRIDDEPPQLSKHTESIQESDAETSNEAELQVTLFQILLVWLVLDIILIRLAWHVYGTALSSRFMKCKARIYKPQPKSWGPIDLGCLSVIAVRERNFEPKVTETWLFLQSRHSYVPKQLSNAGM